VCVCVCVCVCAEESVVSSSALYYKRISSEEKEQLKRNVESFSTNLLLLQHKIKQPF